VLGLLVGLLRILFVLLVIRIIGRFVSAAIRGYRGEFAGTARPAPPLGTRDLVRDPVCGTFVARDRAITARVGGDTRFFCSDACRDTALAGPTPKALHG
jgi:YHS domain-containing protein